MTTAQALRHYLTQSAWQQLKALLAAHHLPRAAGDAKATVIETLCRHLAQPATLHSSIAQLDAVGKGAISALLASDGALSRIPFEQRFGPVRPYRPWRQADAAGVTQPWLAPISTTETLWYLGLIFRDPPKAQPGVVQQYVIPAECRPHLTELLRQPALSTPTTPRPLPGRHGPLTHHLAIWLATVHAARQGGAVKPVYQRWLPPSVVALLCDRLGLAQEAGFRPIKSERHHPYLAFLHYLALAADLVAVTPAAFQLTPAAWAWLDAGTATRHQQLYQAWRAAPAELARPFAFPWEPLTPAARADLLPQLAWLCQQPPHPLPFVIEQWRLHDQVGRLPSPRPTTLLGVDFLPPSNLPHAGGGTEAWSTSGRLPPQPGEREPTLGAGGVAENLPPKDPTTWYADADEPWHDPLAALTVGPLHWLGLLAVQMTTDAAAALFVSGDARWASWLLALPNAPPPLCPPPAPCILPKAPGHTILAPGHVQPRHLVHLARFCEWSIAATAQAMPHAFTLAPARIAQLAAAGVRPEQLLEQLQAALGRPPSRRLRQQVLAWARPGQQLRLRPLLVLEADSAERLAHLRRFKLVRQRLGEVIAPTRIALNPTDAAALVQTLRTLGYYVEPPAPESGVPLPELVEGNDASAPVEALPEPVAGGLTPALQWFLLTLYNGLGAYLALPLDLPWTVQQALRAQLTPRQQATAEAAARKLLDQLQQALNGYLQLTPWQMPATADPEPTLRAALAQGRDVTLRYHGAGSGQITTRTVTPYWIEERHGSRYLIAYCHLRQQERVFRLDHIEAVE